MDDSISTARYRNTCHPNTRNMFSGTGIDSSADGICSKPTVVINLPYINDVNRLEQKSKNARRCAKYKKKKQESTVQMANKAKITKL